MMAYLLRSSQLRPLQQEIHKGSSLEVPQQSPPQRAVPSAAVGGGGQESSTADQRDGTLRCHIGTNCRWNTTINPFNQ